MGWWAGGWGRWWRRERGWWSFNVLISSNCVLFAHCGHAASVGQGSPFVLEVEPDQTLPTNCDAEGPGLFSAVAGTPAMFTIFKRDRRVRALCTIVMDGKIDDSW